jgi:hypothetical protein
MTAGRIIELALALAIIGVGVVLYRRPVAADDAGADRYGSQGAVLLFVVGAIMTIHALGLMQYRPSAAEAGMPHQVLR